MRRFLTGLTLAAALAVPLSVTIPLSHASAGDQKNSRAELAGSLPQSKMTGVTFEESIDFLRDVTGANINVNWKAIEAAGISKDTLVNLNLRNVAAGKVLSLILDQVGPGGKLCYYIEDNIVEITTQEEADKKVVTEVYYVDDILTANDQFDPTINVANALNSALGNSGAAGGNTGGVGGTIGGNSGAVGGSQGIGSLGLGSSGYSSGGNNGSNNSSNSNSSTNIYSASYKAQKAADLIKLIETVIRPEIWKDNGGTATMEYYNGHLIVSAPRLVQEAIGGPIR
jgi:hypothetical protein